LRIEGSIWFGAADCVAGRLRALEARQSGQQELLLLLDGVNFVDVAGAESLAQEAERRSHHGGKLHLAGLKSGVCKPLTRGDYLREIGAESTYERTSDAIADIVPALDPEVCRHCTARIFNECRRQPRLN
jgi:SulP family sulfate permease